MIKRSGQGILLGITLGLLVMGTGTGCATAQQTPRAGAGPTDVRLYGSPQSAISSGVVLPANAAMVWTSGIVAPVADANAPQTSRERFGDTYTQARNIFLRIQENLAEHGLRLNDVVYIRAYVAPDPANNNQFDFAGWNRAYGEFFNNAQNPTKVARSTVGVAALVSPSFLIELEAFAAFPAGR